jgi:hypothetical protein
MREKVLAVALCMHTGQGASAEEPVAYWVEPGISEVASLCIMLHIMIHADAVARYATEPACCMVTLTSRTALIRWL